MKQKEIKIVIPDVGFGLRVLCNLSPEELKKRKKEVIKNFLNNLNLEIDFALDGDSESPTPSRDLSGYWSYFININ